MKKPDVSIMASPTLVSGARCPIDIDVTAHDETRVDFIRARITGQQGWSVGSGRQKVSVRLSEPEIETELMGKGVLPEGSTTRFSTAFKLPDGTPPTHEIAPAYSRMRLRIHISIPWRIDGRYHYDFAVRLPAPPEVVRTPHAISSPSDGAAHDKPRIELGLGSTNLIAGETLVGTCALFHLDDREPREVELSLVPMLDLSGRGRLRKRRGEEITATLTMPAGSAGMGVPFRFDLPRNLAPSFACETHCLSWWLTARTGSFFGPKVDVALPLHIVDASAAASASRLTSAPRLGDERVAAELAKLAARRGWQGGDPARPEHDDDDETAGQLAIERELDGCRLRIAYSYRAEDGTFLVSRIGHPSLGLGLSVTPSSALRHMFFRDIEVDIAAWDRAHRVTARSEEQAIPVLRAIVPALQQAADLGTLVRWSDDALVHELPVTGVKREQLEAMATALEQLAPVIAEAQRAVAPPPGLAVDAPAWRALADELDGTIALGDLSIEGAFQGAPVELGLVWDDEQRPQSIWIAVGDPEAASAELRAIRIELPRPAADVLAAPSASQLVELVTRWPEDVVDLRVQDGAASALLRLPVMAPPAAEVAHARELVAALLQVPPGERPAADAARARELIAALRAVLAALDPGRGPYR
jgi:hypothetical protein